MKSEAGFRRPLVNDQRRLILIYFCLGRNFDPYRVSTPIGYFVSYHLQNMLNRASNPNESAIQSTFSRGAKKVKTPFGV